MFPGYLIPIHELHHAHSSSEIYIENHEHALLHAESTRQCSTHSFLMHQNQISRAGAFLPVLELPPPPHVFYERERVLSRVSSRSSLSARAGSSSEDDHLLLEAKAQERPRVGNSEVKMKRFLTKAILKSSDFVKKSEAKMCKTFVSRQRLRVLN